MKISKINYKSAIFFAFFALVMYFILALIIVVSGEYSGVVMDEGVSAIIQTLILVPIMAAIVVYLLGLVGIFLYNKVGAKTFPISGDVKK